MKYIRTKDGITTKEKFWLKNGGVGELIGTKEADTIEELCDEFVFVGQDNVPILMETLQQCLDRIKDLGLVNYKIYGSIWVQLSSGSWGLKPVAKMNDKGELELL